MSGRDTVYYYDGSKPTDGQGMTNTLSAAATKDGVILTDSSGLKNVGLDLKVVLLNKDDQNAACWYNGWSKIFILAIIIFLFLICIKLLYILCIRCMEVTAQKGRDRQKLTASCESVVSSVDADSPIARDAGAPKHRVSLPEEIPTIGSYFGEMEKKEKMLWQESECEINQSAIAKMEEALGPNQDQYLAHLEGDVQTPGDWDLGQGGLTTNGKH